MSIPDENLSRIGFEMSQPSEMLRPFIQCYWFIRTGEKLENTITNKIVSDGGSGITFNFGSPFFLQISDRECLVKDRKIFTGVTDKTAYLKLCGRVDAVGVRFYPGVHSMVFDETEDGFAETVFPLKGEMLKGISDIYEELRPAETAKRVQILNRHLEQVFAECADGEESWLMQVLNHIRNRYGSAKIDSISEKFSLSRRQFERKFKMGTGLTPKQFSKIVRIEKARSLMQSEDVDSLTTVGYECEYYDQAHFIREFKDVVKLTPKQYLRSKKMSRFYNSK